VVERGERVEQLARADGHALLPEILGERQQLPVEVGGG
jgi:hypothetical protein